MTGDFIRIILKSGITYEEVLYESLGKRYKHQGHRNSVVCWWPDCISWKTQENQQIWRLIIKSSVILYYYAVFFSKFTLINSVFWLFISSFQDFDIQGSRRCSLDWLTIETYKNIESYRACGSTVPPPYISSQDHVWIRFHSDDSISRKGFRLAYFSGMFF